MGSKQHKLKISSRADAAPCAHYLKLDVGIDIFFTYAWGLLDHFVKPLLRKCFFFFIKNVMKLLQISEII